ncbi:MAG: YdcF family protein [Verrucomicrobia bacterium]|nr:YdcF family protein [Verrucomicrobiota bacterium]
MFKKIVTGFLSPLSLINLSLFVGMYCLVSSKRIRSAKLFFLSGLVMALVFSAPWVADALLHNLETQCEPYSFPSGTSPKWILVLGQGVKEGDVPETSRVNGTMYSRLMEAVRISRQLDSARIIVSISGRIPAEYKTSWWSSFCSNTRMDLQNSIVLTEPRDTEEELRQALRYIRNDPFILVTSASHMPRSMLIAEKLGGKAVSAPCDFEGYPAGPFYKQLTPSSRALFRTEKALHEYLGLLWFRLTHTAQDQASNLGAPSL